MTSAAMPTPFAVIAVRPPPLVGSVSNRGRKTKSGKDSGVLSAGLA
jgi:hypothetical protein